LAARKGHPAIDCGEPILRSRPGAASEAGRRGSWARRCALGKWRLTTTSSPGHAGAGEFPLRLDVCGHEPLRGSSDRARGLCPPPRVRRQSPEWATTVLLRKRPRRVPRRTSQSSTTIGAKTDNPPAWEQPPSVGITGFRHSPPSTQRSQASCGGGSYWFHPRQVHCVLTTPPSATVVGASSRQPPAHPVSLLASADRAVRSIHATTQARAPGIRIIRCLPFCILHQSRSC